MRPVWLTLGVLVLAVGAPAAAGAQSDLGSIRELIQQARFGDAVTQARSFLERPNLDAATRNAGLEVLAIAQIANRARGPAQQTLEQLYRRDPGHRLSDADASPPVIGAFARARERAPDPFPVVLEHTPPTLERREPPTLIVRVPEGGDAVAEIRLVYRIAGEGESRVVMTRRNDGSYSARVPVVGDATAATDVSYYIVAMAPSLTALGTVGDDATPLQVRIPAEAAREASGPVSASIDVSEPVDREPGVGEQWWFWLIIVGVVAAGAAITVGIVLGPSAQSPEEGTLGTARLMLRF